MNYDEVYKFFMYFIDSKIKIISIIHQAVLFLFENKKNKENLGKKLYECKYLFLEWKDLKLATLFSQSARYEKEH